MRSPAHAVDRPLRVAVLVTDGDGEAPVVSSDEVDDVSGLALHV